MAQVLIDADRSDGATIGADTIVVVDEAAMVPTRKLSTLLGWAGQAGAKVVLVGDHHQLPEVEAGGAFRGLAERLGAAELTANVRQASDGQRWERHALDVLRSGSCNEIAAVVSDYRDHGRVTIAADAAATREAMVADWAAADQAGADVVMVAVANRDVDDLNVRARAVLAERGELGETEIVAAGRSFAVGDRVLCVSPDRRLAVINGTTGTVTAVHPGAGEVTIVTPDGATRLSGRYLSDGHLRHAYASTVHKTQGRTVDVALVLGNDALYRQSGYVAASRGRHHNHFYLTGDPDAPGVEDHGAWAPQQSTPTAELARTLTVDRRQRLATDHTTPDGPQSLSTLWAAHDRAAAQLYTTAPPDPGGAADAAAASSVRLEQARRNREHAEEQLDAIGSPLRRTERFLARRRLAETQRIEDDWANRHRHHQQTRADVEHARDQWVAANRDHIEELDRLETRIGRAAARQAHEAAADPPGYVVTTVGPTPDDQHQLAAWQKATAAIISYRARTSQTDPDIAVSPPTPNADPALAAHWDTIDTAITAAQPTLPDPAIDMGHGGPAADAPAELDH